MMILQEAIEKEKSIAKSNYELADSYHTDFNVYMRQESACRERAEYHEQIAEWLEELKQEKQELKQEPYEKFESTKDHIYKLAGDYKCWDNRLTHDEALELCHILEEQQNPNSIRINFVGEEEAKEFEEYLKNQQESVLDKIKAEIDTQDKWLARAGYTAYNVDIAFNSIKRVIAESEETE